MTQRTRLLCILIVLCVLLCASVAVLLLLPPRDIPKIPSETSTGEATTTQSTTTEEILAEPIFGYNGDFRTCLNRDSLLGIDVSRYQGEIDWQKVKDAGVEFVIIRVGLRGYGKKGVMVEDANAQKNYQGAKAAGLKVGAYFFSQATSVSEAVEEANYILELTKDWALDMPLVCDWECLAEDYRTFGMDARAITDCIKAFCDTVADAGKQAMIYCNLSQSPKEMFYQELTDYPFWFALYEDTPNFPCSAAMWQYTNEGSVPGIKGNVDINLFFPEEI